ncbi:LysR family transcriptional regulator [Frigidibacter mobilis]|uniref:LysR family transcriptional regulator n=1 Tax=Frigidibacter mobilis TaxID=1335048 RepID=A0A165SU48_9RHOB|nr:LysR substrate-binding domain-containing protein [Frigidibacter mobilis]AMY71119.1 LysR family transcriptional regulator [Frigidibacter mobilis]
MRRLPPLSALPAFEATARLGSVTAAGAELGRTHGAISKQIAHLSEDLGGGLFEKAGNGLKLTSRGERLRNASTALLDDLSALAQVLRSEQDERQIDILTSATFATRWLIPRLPRFYMRCPDVDLRLRMSGPQAVPDHDFDVLVSYDRLRSPTTDMDGQIIGDTSYGIVCAPGYPLQEMGHLWTAPVAFVQVGAPQSWQMWMRLADVEFRAEQEVEHAHHLLALEAAAAGLGVALAERRLVDQDLSTGRLVAPLGFRTVPGGLLAVVTPRASRRSTVAVLIEWLREEAL